MQTLCGEAFAGGLEGDGGESEGRAEKGGEGAAEGMAYEPDGRVGI